MIDKIFNGDCLEVMKAIPDHSVDMILADLPYGTTACKWDTIIPFEPLWAQYKRIIKEHGAIVLTASQPFTSMLVMSNPKWFKYEWIWEKERPTNIFTMKKQVGKVHEHILIFFDSHHVYNPIMEQSKQPKNNIGNKSQIGEMNSLETIGKTKTKISSYYDHRARYPRSVIRFSRGTRNNGKLHPTQKPVALFEYLIRTYTNEGEVVLDNVIGSGTTAIACMNTRRHFIGIEKDEKYFNIAQERISAHVVNI